MAIHFCSDIFNLSPFQLKCSFETSLWSEKTAIWLSGFTALAQVAGVLISLYLIEKKGRRPLVLSSLFFVTLSLIGLGSCFYLGRISSGKIGNPGINEKN